VGRVYGLSELTYAGAGGIGALLAPLLVDWLGAPGSMAAVGIPYALLGGLAWRPLSRLDAGQEEATRVRALLCGIPFMKPLPLPRLERLVRSARPVTIPEGETIITRGEHGDDFFAIETGTVEIVEYGQTQGAGEGFGEIALLRDIPRTATVRATTEVRLRALARSAFLAAVTQHGEARSVSDSVVATHLSRETVSRPA
jgi:CRP-like cAMP-binding protein